MRLLTGQSSSLLSSPDPADQERLIREIILAQQGQREAAEGLKSELLAFSDLIDGRGVEELPELENGDDERVPEVGID
jgi:hypothetical protein